MLRSLVVEDRKCPCIVSAKLFGLTQAYSVVQLLMSIRNTAPTIFVILLANPLGALVVDLAQGFSHHHIRNLDLQMYLFATGFAAIVPLIFLLFQFLAMGFPESPTRKGVILTGWLLMVGLTLFIQIQVYWYLHTSSTAAVGFFFSPIYFSGFYAVGSAMLLGICKLKSKNLTTPKDKNNSSEHQSS